MKNETSREAGVGDYLAGHKNIANNAFGAEGMWGK